MIRTAPYNPGNQYNVFRRRRSSYFHQCADTGKLIWPFQLSYYSDYVDVTVRLQLRSYSAPIWISPAAYTFRTLQEKHDT